MGMGAFLRDRRRLRQPAVDVPVNLAVRVNNLLGIILRDNWDGFPFAPSGLEVEARIGLRCLAYGLLSHWSDRIHCKRWPQTFGNCSLAFFRDRLRRFLGDRSFRLFDDRLRRLVSDHFCRLFVDGWFWLP